MQAFVAFTPVSAVNVSMEEETEDRGLASSRPALLELSPEKENCRGGLPAGTPGQVLHNPYLPVKRSKGACEAG